MRILPKVSVLKLIVICTVTPIILLVSYLFVMSIILTINYDEIKEDVRKKMMFVRAALFLRTAHEAIKNSKTDKLVLLRFSPSSKRYIEICNGKVIPWNKRKISSFSRSLSISIRPDKIAFQFWIQAGLKRPKRQTSENTCFGLIDHKKHFPSAKEAWFVLCARGDPYKQHCEPNRPPIVLGISSSKIHPYLFFKMKRPPQKGKIK